MINRAEQYFSEASLNQEKNNFCDLKLIMCDIAIVALINIFKNRLEFIRRNLICLRFNTRGKNCLMLQRIFISGIVNYVQEIYVFFHSSTRGWPAASNNINCQIVLCRKKKKHWERTWSCSGL